MQPHAPRIVPLPVSSRKQPQSETTAAGKADLALFGGFSLCVNGRRLTVSRQHASLIAYLARQRGCEISRDRLSTMYWGDSASEQARRNLRVALSRIKRSLSSSGAVPEVIRTSTVDVSMPDSAPISVDANRFEWLIQNNCDIKQLSDTKVASLQEAVKLYKECLLPGFDDDWIVVDRELLRNKYIFALRILVFHYTIREDFAGAVAWAMRILREEPYDESIAIFVMRLLCLQGQRTCAIKIFRTLSHELRTEFGISPSARAVELFQSIASDSPLEITLNLSPKDLEASLQVSPHAV